MKAWCGSLRRATPFGAADAPAAFEPEMPASEEDAEEEVPSTALGLLAAAADAALAAILAAVSAAAGRNQIRGGRAC